jgi:thiol:disulfide interchange protein DsbD
MRYLLLLVALILSSQAWAEDVGEELLPPEQAYRMQAQAKGPQTLVVRWQIADGYYMYRDKFDLRIETPGVRAGPPRIPPGKVKHDEFFGDVEIFRKTVSIELPLQREPGTPDTITLKTVSQGCADIGVCYPPLTQTASLTLPPPTALGPDPGPSGALGALSALLTPAGDDEDFLPPDAAFRFAVEPKDGETLIARWQVAPGYYLYRDKMRFTLEQGEGVALGDIALPKGKLKHDEFFGDVEVYTHDLAIEIPLIRQHPDAAEITLKSVYPPIEKVATLSLPPTQAATGSGPGTGAEPAQGPDDTGFRSEQDQIAQTLAAGGTWLTVLSFFGFGLLLAFTPCVFPMFPILSGIIIGQGAQITTRKAFMLSGVYVLAMAVTYTVAGVVVGLSGENVQAWFQNPWVLSVFAGVFVLLALSMFGFYELQMPNAIQSRLTRISNSQHGGTLAGAGIMGFLSALIVGPCVTAPLIGALIYIADTGDALLGGLALFALALGMGTPLLALGTSAGKLLPKAGPWMDTTKAVFGVLLLGVAIWLLERILPIQAVMVLTGILLVVSAIYMGALEGLQDGASGWVRLWKGVGLVLLIYGATLLVGAAAGGNSVIQPLRGVLMAQGPSDTAPAEHGLRFERIKDLQGLNAALERARQQGQGLMLDFYADWCISCKEMEAYTFTDPAVRQALEEVMLVQVDVTLNDAGDRALLKHFGLFGPPAILFFTPEGEERRDYRVVGFMPAERFAGHVHNAFAVDSET